MLIEHERQSPISAWSARIGSPLCLSPRSLDNFVAEAFTPRWTGSFPPIFEILELLV